MMQKKTAKRRPKRSEPRLTFDNTPEDLLEMLDEDLSFSQESLVEDATKQPLLFIKAGKIRVQALGNLAKGKLRLETFRAETASRIRHELTQNDERVTEGRITELVGQDPTFVEEQEKFVEDQTFDELSRLVVEAFRQRRDCLRLVSDLVSSEISLQAAVERGKQKLDSVRRRVKEKYSE